MWLRTLAGVDDGGFFDALPAEDGTLVAVGTTEHTLAATMSWWRR